MTAFDDLAEFAALPRLTALALGADGDRLVATVDSPDTASARYVGALWQIDPTGGDPQRLTRSEQGEAQAAFLPDGRLLFVSARPGVAVAEEDEKALWTLPASRRTRSHWRDAPAGCPDPRVAAASGHVVVAGSRLARSDESDDEQRRTTRKDRKITAILHAGFPIRMWDHELGVESARLLVLDPGAGAAARPRPGRPPRAERGGLLDHRRRRHGRHHVAGAGHRAAAGSRRSCSSTSRPASAASLLRPDGEDDVLAPGDQPGRCPGRGAVQSRRRVRPTVP